MSAPFELLTEAWIFDMIHRRAGGTARPWRMVQHADAHKYCPLGRCGTRPGAYARAGPEDHPAWSTRSAKITAWRKAKALANRRYLEEYVYGDEKKESLG